MAQTNIQSYFLPLTSQSKPNKRKAVKVSGYEEGNVKSIAKKKSKHEESPGSLKKQNIKAVSIAALFGGEPRRESKQKVACKLEPVSGTLLSTPTKTGNAPQTLRRSPRISQKLALLPQENVSPQKKVTVKCEFKEDESTQYHGRTRRHDAVKNKLFEEANNGNEHKKQNEQRKETIVEDKPFEKKAKLNEIDHLKQESRRSSTEKRTPKEASVSDLDTSMLSDEERFERKRVTTRPSVINSGSKKDPKGSPNCLSGLSFYITGVLESFTSEEVAEIIKDLGGKMSRTVGKRVNYVVAGEDAGPKKLAVAETLNISILSLDELFELIKQKSNNTTQTKFRISPEKIKVEKTSPFKIGPAHKVSPVDSRKETRVSPRTKNVEKTSPVKVKHEDVISPVKIRKAEELKISTNVELSKIRVHDEVMPKTDNDNYSFNATKPVNDDNIAWVDKYKPTSVKQIIGQHGAGSNCAKLMNWLKNWHSNQSGGRKHQKPNPWAKNDDGSYYKAALLSGPPGVGKTTTATLVCKDLGFDTVEFNASDTRSKRLLKEEVSELLSNKSLYGYFHGNAQAVSKKHVLIMDEVDGMAGNEDRGGIQELIALIKDSHVPIICMCNDRNHQKMRSLVNYCYDLRFTKPRLEQIKGVVKSICFKEKVKLSTEKIDEIILATNNDIRQSINHLCLLSASKDTELKSDSQKTAQKDLKMGPWEIVRKVFSAEEHKHMSLDDKFDLFFHDYSMSPLFVQQNYLAVSPSGPRSEVLKKVALSADALSMGDLVDRRIRTNSAWTLLPVQAVFSSFLPGEYMEGHFTGQINFPGWLGKYSRTNKRSRLAQEIHDHTRLRTSGSRLSIRMDYAPFLLSHIVRPLQDKGIQGIEESLKVIQEYRLLREDIDSLIELTNWPGKKSPMDAVEGKIKAALTRLYNKEVLPYSYSLITAPKKKKSGAADGDIPLELMENETEIVESEEESYELENDNRIKVPQFVG